MLWCAETWSKPGEKDWCLTHQPKPFLVYLRGWGLLDQWCITTEIMGLDNCSNAPEIETLSDGLDIGVPSTTKFQGMAFAILQQELRLGKFWTTPRKWNTSTAALSRNYWLTNRSVKTKYAWLGTIVFGIWMRDFQQWASLIYDCYYIHNAWKTKKIENFY